MLRIYRADGFRERLLGLHALRDRQACALWLPACRAIHTLTLRRPIDVYFLDRDLRLLQLRRGLGPGRIALCLGASSVLECPAGVLAEDPHGLPHAIYEGLGRLRAGQAQARRHGPGTAWTECALRAAGQAAPPGSRTR